MNGNSEAMIDGQTIPDFLASLDDRVKITQQEVLKLVQIFDMRVKTLIKSIIMDRNSPFKANYYNYRVEFQARGHPHIHGVLFCDTKQIEDELNLKDLHDTLEKLRMTRTLSVTEKRLVASFIDNFTVCSMTNDIKDTVREVQWHRHTKRKCQKKDLVSMDSQDSQQSIQLSLQSYLITWIKQKRKRNMIKLGKSKTKYMIVSASMTP